MRLFRPFYEDYPTAFIPEIWANEGILILSEEMVMGNLVHRDFTNEIAKFGETVHTRKPGEFVGTRKGRTDEVTDQDLTATEVDVVLNQHVHVSFMLLDEDRTKSFQDLVTIYLTPALQANARVLDQALTGAAFQFLANTRGALKGLSKSNAADYLVDARDLMNQNKAYAAGRNLVLASNSEAQMLKTEMFIKANESPEGGRAMREAYLGMKFGFNTFMDLNVPSASGTVVTTTTTSAAAVKGAASVAITAAVGVGRYVTIAGDMTPLRSTTNTTTLTPTRAIREAVASGAVVTKYLLGKVDLTAGYVDGWVKAIHVDDGGLDTCIPRVGQLVSFNAGDEATGTVRTPEYMITQVTNTAGNDYDIVLDRPLETALANNDVVAYGPDGDYNFAFHRNALALVNRPLALPMEGAGARSAVANYNGMAMRVVIAYDSKKQGHRVTLDSLFGVAPLDTNLGAVLLG